MAKIYILIALLPQLLYTLVHGQESPCPQYFTYIVKPGTDETIGRIEIQSPPKTGELHLKVVLSVAAELPTKYVGRLELARSKEESAEAVRQGRNLLYHLHFPLRQPFPKLTGIWFNNEQYCSGPEATGNFVTTIMLEHTLLLPNLLSVIPNFGPTTKRPSTTTRSSITPTVTLSRGIRKNIFLDKISDQQLSRYTNNIFLYPENVRTTPMSTPKPNIFLFPNTISIPQPTPQPTPRPTPKLTPKPTPKPTPMPPVTKLTPQYECGKRIGSLNLLISQGQRTSPGEWPWLVALFVVKHRYEFQCGGTLLTNKHVLTAAHCLMLNRTHYIHHNVLVVALGRFNLHQFRERGTVNHEVKSYNVHPDYSYALTGDSDIAIMTLRNTVDFSIFIRPICLWSGPPNIQNVINRMGYVVGWGQDERGNPWTEDPRMAMMPIVSLDTCHWSSPGFVSLTSNRTFCAGTLDGSGPCNGDSGSGLVLYDNVSDRYHLRGVVSRSVLGNEPLCDLTKYVVFVDVAQYIPWIQQRIST